MRALVINPNTKTVDEVFCDGSLRDIYRLTQTQVITSIVVDQDHHMYLDDEGLLRQNPRFFLFARYPQPLAGCGLILAHDREGNEVSTTLSLSAIRGAVQWARPDLRVSGFETMETESGGVHVMSHLPVFAVGPTDT